MKVSVDIHKSYAGKPLTEIRDAIQTCITLRARFSTLAPGSYQDFTDCLRNITLLAQTLGGGKISDDALAVAREFNRRWKRPLTPSTSKPLKLYLSENDYYAWIAHPVAERNGMLNDFLSVGTVLERAASEQPVRALVSKVWDYWMAHQDSDQAWQYVSETLEALA